MSHSNPMHRGTYMEQLGRRWAKQRTKRHREQLQLAFLFGCFAGAVLIEIAHHLG